MENENITPTPEEETTEELAKNPVNTTDEGDEIVEESESETTAEASELESADDETSETPLEDNAEEDVTDSAEYTYTSRKGRKRGKKKSVAEKKSATKSGTKKGGFKARFVIIPAVAAAVLAGGFFALPLLLPDEMIAKNVYVGDIDLSYLTEKEAEELLATEYTPEETEFSVVFETETESVSADFTAEEIEFSTDIKGTASDAYSFGRGANALENSWNVLRSVFTKVNIGARPDFNKDTLSDILYELGAQVYGRGEDVQITVENNTLSITPATPGQSHNLTLAIAEFSNSVRKGITKDIPITLKSNESDKLDANELYKELVCEPQNAEYTIENNEVIITDHVVGLEIDKAKLSALVEQVNNGIAGTIDVVQTMPEITTESIQKSLFGTQLATFSSNYASSSANRAYNVELAASKINGLILPDGAEFSYNNIVGNANAANGFKMATIFSDGKQTEGVGGGVCQVSSTLYCAVLRSDLEVTERHNHSLPIGYVPGGQDATVSYGVLDFRFKNNTGAPIKIEAVCSSRNLTVSILGSPEAKKNVEVVSQKVSSIEPTMTETKDASLPAGTTKVVTKGKAGSVYVTYKRVYDANGAMIKETSTRSSYRATPGEIRIGTAAVSAPTTEPSTPSSSSPSTEPATTPAPEPEEPEIMPDGYPDGI